MTVQSTNRVAGPYTGNDSTTVFPFSFMVFEASDLEVISTDLNGVETTLTLTTDYTVTLNADQNTNPGGTVTTTNPPATGYLLTLTSQLAATQDTSITNAGGFYPQVFETAFDKLTILVQQCLQGLSRAVLVDISSSTPPSELLNDINTAVANSEAQATAAAASASSAASSATNASSAATTASAAAASATSSSTTAQASAAAAAVSAADAAASAANFSWGNIPIGQPFPLADYWGAPPPPTDNPNYQFIKLTAADAYNGSLLTNESVSGSAPTITATAEISLAASPMDGQTIRLINTEGRFLRPGTSYAIADSQFGSHDHTLTDPTHLHSVADPSHSHQLDGLGGTLWNDGAAVEYTLSGGGNVVIGGNYSNAAGAGIGIYGAYTGITIAATGAAESAPRQQTISYYMRIA